MIPIFVYVLLSVAGLDLFDVLAKMNWDISNENMEFLQQIYGGTVIINIADSNNVVFECADATHSRIGIAYSFNLIPTIRIPREHGLSDYIESPSVHVKGELQSLSQNGYHNRSIATVIEEIENDTILVDLLKHAQFDSAIIKKHKIMFVREQYWIEYQYRSYSHVRRFNLPPAEYNVIVFDKNTADNLAEWNLSLSDAVEIKYENYQLSVRITFPESGNDTLIFENQSGLDTPIFLIPFGWKACPEVVDISYMKSKVIHYLESCGLSSDYVSKHFTLDSTFAIREPRYHKINKEIRNRTRIIGKFSFRWFPGDAVTTKMGGFLINVYVVYLEARPSICHYYIGSGWRAYRDTIQLDEIDCVSFNRIKQEIPNYHKGEGRLYLKFYRYGVVPYLDVFRKTKQYAGNLYIMNLKNGVTTVKKDYSTIGWRPGNPLPSPIYTLEEKENQLLHK